MNPKKEKRDRKKRRKSKTNTKVPVVVTHHKSAATVKPELKKDIVWFRKRPFASQRSRPPSARERREWGPNVIEVLVMRRGDGGIVTVPIKIETAHA